MLAPTHEARTGRSIKDKPLAPCVWRRVERGHWQSLWRAEVLSVAGLSGIELYEPGALTIVAKQARPWQEIEAALGRQKPSASV